LEEKRQKKVPKKKWPPEQELEEKLRPPEETTEEVEARAKQLIRRHRLVEIIKKIIKHRNKDINDEIKLVLLSGLYKYI